MAQERTLPEGVTLEHPNREKASSRSTRVIVVILMIASALLIGFIQIGGWKVNSAMALISFGYIVLYLLFAFYVARWRRGMLPVGAGMATIVLVNALIAVPSWSDRHAVGFTIDTASPTLLAALAAILVPVQILLIGFALRGFRQNWHVEVERLPDGTTRRAPAF